MIRSDGLCSLYDRVFSFRYPDYITISKRTEKKFGNMNTPVFFIFSRFKNQNMLQSMSKMTTIEFCYILFVLNFFLVTLSQTFVFLRLKIKISSRKFSSICWLKCEEDISKIRKNKFFKVKNRGFGLNKIATWINQSHVSV